MLTVLSIVTIFSGLNIDAAAKQPCVGDIINGISGQEKIINILTDGKIVTISLDSDNKLCGIEALNEPCSHNVGYVEIGNKKMQTESYNKTNSSYCYKQRTCQEVICARCHANSIYIYGQWENISHSYPLFSKTCKKCGYQK